MSSPVAIAGIIAGVILLWVMTSRAVSILSGWAWLADSYAARLPFEGEKWHARSVGMRWILLSYNNCVTLGADREGLFIKVMPLMKFGHPPLFIPWSDVSVERGNFFMSRFVRMRFKKQPNVPVVVSEKTALQLAAAAGDAWPEAKAGQAQG